MELKMIIKKIKLKNNLKLKDDVKQDSFSNLKLKVSAINHYYQDLFFWNPVTAEEDFEYEYGDPVGRNVPQSQTLSGKCDAVEKVGNQEVLQRGFGNTYSSISQTSTPRNSRNIFKVKEEYTDEILLDRYATTLSYPETNCLDESIPDLVIDMSTPDMENSPLPLVRGSLNSEMLLKNCDEVNKAQKDHQEQEEDVEEGDGDEEVEDLKCTDLNTFMLEKQMRLSVSPYENELRVDIRYLNNSLYRTRKGLSLLITQFKMIVENLELFDQTFQKMRDVIPGSEKTNLSIHLGGKRWMYIKASYQTVHIRQKYLNQEGQPRVDALVRSISQMVYLEEICRCVSDHS